MTDGPASTPPETRRPWIWPVLHLTSLLAAALLFMRAGRGQWFYYDEWDFLVSRQEWDLLASHNGHLSLFPQLFTTLLKGMFGLHTYWPYLALVILAHLLVCHLLWRFAIRAGAQPWIATLVVAIFAVLAPGSENTLWAFQVGFITPIATGTGAMLLLLRPFVGVKEIGAVAGLLLVGIGFSGTALPITAAVILFLLVRHGWKPALAVALSFAIPYGLWYLTFNRVDTMAAFKAASLHDFLVGIPKYVAHGFVDGLATVLPLAALSAPLILVFACWVVVDVRKTGIRSMSPVHYLTIAAIIFAFLTAYTRLQLGVQTASSWRYVYLYAALLSPAAALALTALTGRRGAALAAVTAALGVIGVYNVGGLMEAGRQQAELEQSVNRAMSAALALDDGDREDGSRRPSPVVAPPLTLADVRDFVERGQYDPVPFAPGDELIARMNLYLDSVALDGDMSVTCALPDSEGFLPLETDDALFESSTDGTVLVRATEESSGAAVTAEIAAPVRAGLNRLTGLGDGIELAIRADQSLCVPAVSR